MVAGNIVGGVENSAEDGQNAADEPLERQLVEEKEGNAADRNTHRNELLEGGFLLKDQQVDENDEDR